MLVDLQMQLYILSMEKLLPCCNIRFVLAMDTKCCHEGKIKKLLYLDSLQERQRVGGFFSLMLSCK